MAQRVKVVTAYCDLGLSKRPAKEFHSLGQQLVDACGEDNIIVYKYAPEEAWTWDAYKGYPAANARALDRFAYAHEHERSNLIQHTPVQWLERAKGESGADIFVWLGYSLLKQGEFTGKRIMPSHVTGLIDKLKHWKGGSLPFPGIEDRILPIDPFGDNWRFVGSTLVVPREFVHMVSASYYANFKAFVQQHKAVPLDLAIWPMVEFSSGLPWRFYQAEYDHTQLTNFHC